MYLPKHVTNCDRSLMVYISQIVFVLNICKDLSVRRSSHRRCSVRKSVPRNFAKFTGKHLCQILFFDKLADLRPATLLKKRL